MIEFKENEFYRLLDPSPIYGLDTILLCLNINENDRYITFKILMVAYTSDPNTFYVGNIIEMHFESYYAKYTTSLENQISYNEKI